MIDRDPARAHEMMAELQRDTASALDDLRDLARGIYPPLLADKGLAAALDSQARRSVVPVEVLPDGIGRYSQEIESAVYFSCLEALQNVAKYAEATRATLTLRSEDGVLSFEVTDDGRGFDPRAALPRVRDPGDHRPARRARRPPRRSQRARERNDVDRHPPRGGNVVSGRTAARIAWTLLGLDLALLIAAVMLEGSYAQGDEDAVFIYGGIALVLGYGGVGALISSRHPRNAIGWLFCAIATGFAITAFADEFVTRGLATGSDTMLVPLAWLNSWAFVIPLVAVPLVLLLFPNGRPPSPRWNVLIWAIVGLGAMAALGFIVSPKPLETPEGYHLANPTAIRSAPWLGDLLLTVGGLGSLVAAIASLVALIVRFRRSSGDERQQIRWLAYVGLIGTRRDGRDVRDGSVRDDQQPPVLPVLPDPRGRDPRRHRDRDPEEPALRVRPRDPQDAGVRRARHDHHGDLRRHRRGDRDDHDRVARPVADRDGDHGRALPTDPATRRAPRRPARVRSSRRAVRGARALQRARGRVVRRRRRDPADRARDRGGGRRDPRGDLAPDR